LDSLLIQPKPPQTWQVRSGDSASGDGPTPWQQGQKLMPYFPASKPSSFLSLFIVFPPLFEREKNFLSRYYPIYGYSVQVLKGFRWN
jgi:hypothetical protein